MMIASTGAGTSFERSAGEIGGLANRQCTHSIGSDAVKEGSRSGLRTM